jgi:hypothetical protein
VAGRIGGAEDFWRLRIIRVDESDAPEMEWRDDILYRQPRAEEPEEYDVWRIEAIDVDDDENVVLIETCDSAEDASARLGEIAEDLAVMTRSEFERTFFPPAPSSEATSR